MKDKSLRSLRSSVEVTTETKQGSSGIVKPDALD